MRERSSACRSNVSDSRIARPVSRATRAASSRHPGESEGGHGGDTRRLSDDQVPVKLAGLAPDRQVQRTQRLAVRLTRLCPPALTPSPATHSEAICSAVSG